MTATAAKEQFDRQAGLYNERWASWSDETLRRMLELADPRPEWNVLDAATGAGFTALAFAPHVRRAVGLDVSPGMLAQAAKRAREQGLANAEWCEAPAERLPFAPAVFDLVTVRIAPHHFTDVNAFLRETKRVLKPGGLFILGDTAVPDNAPEAAAWQNTVEQARDTSHVANLSAEEWQRRSEAAGLTVTHLEYRPGAIRIPLSAWLETAGCAGKQAEKVRALFAEAPETARQHFHIVPDDGGETYFAWARVILRAVNE